ncbi:YbhB/YbcL family Raf kinase inhibitor-like protein [Bifidobacterium choloepi]|uniref:YbhB/YbcL family Raf kinase inhibitor-like protein n=1 Tax=Bifidobacterium choloepi TaxID=2614131 RepID=A0A6I5MZX3_9BIFI|nr:YbhB/YbcL family Raf kinase inhibitor-like protein [Bifidobacterium choloepi]NEG69817.1 YbhB/YbcL family Raf kinase inhibitor-like protein [Bifidobacterium choloepi]
MIISTDFTVIPDEYAKQAPQQDRVDGEPAISFPFYLDRLRPDVHYLHWQFLDPDSIPVCGFEWIHWTVANLPVDALMFDPNDSHALSIPADFSRKLPAMIPEAVQGRNSSASPLLGRPQEPALTMRYNGPVPPDKDHRYFLEVWGTSKPLAGLEQGFWMNEMIRAFASCNDVRDEGAIFLTGRA